MLTKSFKIIAISASFAGLVACGKGMGEKNNRVIDGTYVQAKTAPVDGKVTELAQMVNIVEIKDGIRTQYRVNTVMRRVQITRDRLIIKGSSLVGIEKIEDNCAEENELGLEAKDIRLGKNANGVTFKEEGKNTLLKPYNAKELAALIQQIKAKTYDIGCFDATGNKFTKLSDEDVAATTLDEDKAKEEAAKENTIKDEAVQDDATKTEEVKQEETETVIP